MDIGQWPVGSVFCFPSSDSFPSLLLSGPEPEKAAVGVVEVVEQGEGSQAGIHKYTVRGFDPGHLSWRCGVSGVADLEAIGQLAI